MLKLYFSLYPLKAIRRLSWDDQNLIDEISTVLNKVFIDGFEVDKMMEEINSLHEEAYNLEFNLVKREGIINTC